jgi:uncharacterized protein YjbI with pentapeptide repeats
MIKILNIDGNVIYESNASTLKEAVEEAIKNKVSLFKANLYKADLYEADLRGADLRGVYLYRADLHKAKGIRTFTAGDVNRLCYTYVYDNEQRWQLGYFNGNYKETKKVVKTKYGKDSYYYKMIKATLGSIETQ